MKFNKIKTVANLKGITITALAKETGYSRTGFYLAVANDTITLAAYIKICQQLKVSFDTFLDDKDLNLVVKNKNIEASIRNIEAMIMDLKNETEHKSE